MEDLEIQGAPEHYMAPMLVEVGEFSEETLGSFVGNDSLYGWTP